METKPVMLIVDDVEQNRETLRQFFKEDYVVAEAVNGQAALEIIEAQPVSVVLLDLEMPIMNGYELMALLKHNDQYSTIPLIAMTSRDDIDGEARAMLLGAADFITYPYNPAVVRCRVRNVIARHENEWHRMEQQAKDEQLLAMNKAVENDALTGIVNRETFYRQAAKLMKEHVAEKYAIIYLDISCFKVINDLFRVETGNLILKTAAYFFKIVAGNKGVCGRIEADHFVLCLPSDGLDVGDMLAGLDSTIASLGISHNVKFYAGVYQVENAFLPVDQMCDRAHMALNSIKGNYMVRYAYYDKSMREVMLEEQMIVRDMEFALQERQFCVFLQPVYNLHTGHVMSAEALVRWQHPLNGMIAPNKFIPVFERNGFIVRLDRFVWEEVCIFLHKQKENGRPVVPVSVNVSRLNFYNLDLLDFLLKLVKKYDLEPAMLKLEVTESAYIDNPRQLITVVREFRAHGFPVLMDDFGTGYSSLNMLKDLPVDVLKIDMAFVQELGQSERANAIMKTIVSMAQNLSMGIVVEGVENQCQIEFLSAIGCEEIQGYYYSCPLPVEEFKALLQHDYDEEMQEQANAVKE